MNPRKVLVLYGHPRAGSFSDALADAYVAGARSQHDVQTLVLRDLRFDPTLHHGYSAEQALESDLLRAQELITWADHLVFAYPIWWGAPPALVLGFVQRTLLPGFAFKYHKEGALWDKLLKGRSARLVVTADSPWWWLAWVTKNPAVKLMKTSVLEFCGVTPVSVSQFPRMRFSSAEQRATWLAQLRTLGEAGR